MQKVYLETTIPSYLTSIPSRDIIILGHKELTKEWWNKYRDKYELFVSQAVVDEVTQGDKAVAALRYDLIKNISILNFDLAIDNIVNNYMKEFSFSSKVILDAYHIAYATFYEIDFLLTWNCKHLANANIRKKLYQINAKLGYSTPEICTPEELINY